MNDLRLMPEECRGRQRRLLASMQQRRVDLVIVTQREHVQWLTGFRCGWVFQSAAALFADGHSILAAPNVVPEDAAADEVVTYEAQWLATLRNDQPQACSEAIHAAVSRRPNPKRLGVEFSSFPPHLANKFEAELIDLEPELYRLRRHKGRDELTLIRKAIAGTERMYRRAREIIAPGISELEVFHQLQAAAVEEFGEMLTGTGNDYQCASAGGPPRDGRLARSGELYILDLGPAFRGYFADNCRTIAVTQPSDAQLEACQFLHQVFDHVERSLKPGTSGRQLYDEACEILGQAPIGEFPHHLGHGFGLFPHEAPHVSPKWDDVFEQGDVVAVEPGLYAPSLQAGLRIENNYLVTEDGVELLTNFSMEL
jgi:Xaa-Pro aminopeptidase